MDSTLARIQKVIRNVFEDDSLVITPETTAADIEAWDSVMHVTLMMEIEAAFTVRFSTSAIAYLKTVGDLVALVESKQTK